MITTKTIHVLIAEAFIPNPKNKPEVNHKDLNKRNNTIDNLEWVTRSEQAYHAISMGSWPDNKGSRNGNSKLSDEARQDIKQRHVKGEHIDDIATIHDVHPRTISRVVYGV